VQSAEPLYVVERDAASNRVTVGPKRELATTAVRLDNARLRRPADQVRQVRLRYHAAPIPCRANVADGGEVQLELEHPAHAVAPGQLACLMRDDCVVGEGTIAESG
jgi:tRNA U34 2-thiouridine synthase MnmA/TrmU